MRNLALSIVAILAFSCGELSDITAPGGSVPPVDASATLTRVQNEIFTPSCAQVGCHDLLGRQQGLVLVQGQAHANLVEIASEQMPALRRVQPGNFADSYLYRKITGTGITGDRMPQGLPPLSAAQVALVRDWIRRGAPND